MKSKLTLASFWISFIFTLCTIAIVERIGATGNFLGLELNYIYFLIWIVLALSVLIFSLTASIIAIKRNLEGKILSIIGFLIILVTIIILAALFIVLAGIK